jgi:hypothetical protein
MVVLFVRIHRVGVNSRAWNFSYKENSKCLFMKEKALAFFL